MLRLLALVFLQSPQSRPAEPPKRTTETISVSAVTDRVVGIINNEVITQSEIDSRIANLIATQGVKDPAAIARARHDEKIQLAYQLLLTQAAKKLAFDEKQIDDGAKKRIEEKEKEAGGRAALHRNIESQGKSVAEWEREQRNLELMQRLLEAETGNDYRPEKEIVITPTLLRNYYKENIDKYKAGPMAKGRVLSISDAKSRSRANGLAQAKDLKDRIVKGADFADLARAHSEFAPHLGGQIPWVERDKKSADPKILEYLFSHEPGDVSDPLEIEGGVAIVKLEAKRPAGLRPFSDQETQEEIMNEIRRAKGNEMRIALVRRLQSEAYIWPADLFQDER